MIDQGQQSIALPAAAAVVHSLSGASVLKCIAVDGEPPWDEHARVIVYTEGTDFAGEQVFDIPVYYFHEPYDAEDPQGPRHEVVEAATHWVLRDDFVSLCSRMSGDGLVGSASLLAVDVDAWFDRDRQGEAVDDAREQGMGNARQGLQDVSAGFDDLPFADCPEAWVEKVFARIVWFQDSGDASVGEPPRSGWSLAPDQAGTVIADLAAQSVAAKRYELLRELLDGGGAPDSLRMALGEGGAALDATLDDIAASR